MITDREHVEGMVLPLWWPSRNGIIMRFYSVWVHWNSVTMIRRKRLAVSLQNAPRYSRDWKAMTIVLRRFVVHCFHSVIHSVGHCVTHFVYTLIYRLSFPLFPSFTFECSSYGRTHCIHSLSLTARSPPHRCAVRICPTARP